MTRTVALAPTLLVALLANAPNQLDVLNQWLNILQSIQLPFAIIPVRHTGPAVQGRTLLLLKRQIGVLFCRILSSGGDCPSL